MISWLKVTWSFIFTLENGDMTRLFYAFSTNQRTLTKNSAFNLTWCRRDISTFLPIPLSFKKSFENLKKYGTTVTVNDESQIQKKKCPKFKTCPEFKDH